MTPYQIDGLIAIFSAVAIVAISSWVLLAILRRRMAERHEIRMTVLGKLSSEEMIRLLESEGGRAWLRDVLAGPGDLRAALERAIAIAFAGLACGFSGMFLHVKVLGVFGIVFLAIGAGQLVAGLLQTRKAAKSGEAR